MLSTFDVHGLTICDDVVIATGYPGVMLLPPERDDRTIVETPGDAFAAACWGDALLVADGHAGLLIVADGKLRQVFDLGGTVTWVTVHEDTAVASIEDGRVVVLGLGGNPSLSPRIVSRGSVALHGIPRFVAFAGPDRVWVSSYTHGMVLLDLEDPREPRVVDAWLVIRKPVAVAGNGTSLAVSGVSSPGVILGVDDGGMIEVRSEFPVDGRIRAMALGAGSLALSDGATYTRTLDLGGEPLRNQDVAAAALAFHGASLVSASLGGEIVAHHPPSDPHALVSLSPHRPSVIVQDGEGILSLSGHGCRGSIVQLRDAGADIRPAFDVGDAECVDALWTRDFGWVMGGPTGIVDVDGDRWSPVPVTDLHAVAPGGPFAVAMAEQKGLFTTPHLRTLSGKPDARGPSWTG